MSKRASVTGKITSARGALAILSLSVLVGAAATPALAAPFTDIFGRKCDTSQLVDNPDDPNGPSICPGSDQGDRTLSRTQIGRGFLKYNGSDDLGLNLALGTPPYPTYNRLGIYVTPDTGFGNGVAFGAGGYGVRSSGVGVTDTAGMLAPGSVSAASRTSAGSGGISGSYDASNLVGSNQKLILDGAFNYTSSKTNYAAGVSSINGDTYGFKGSALYSNYNTYLVLSGAYELGDNSEFFAPDASRGNYRSDSYSVDARLGHVFVLFNSISAIAPPRMSVKAPLRAVDGGYAIGLDFSGHLGYASDVERGFTDTAGFTFGDERAKGGETGLRAKLFAAVPSNGVSWQPYVSGSVDWRFDYSHIAYFPMQVALAGGDAVNFLDGTTFVGVQAGLDVRAANGWTVGVNGFYSHSSDTDIAGGRAYVKIPFGPTTVTARY